MSFPGFLGRKLGMTQVFDEKGSAVPVTVVELHELTITQVKTPEKDGYAAVQVGCVDAKAKHLTKAQQQHLQKNGLPLFRVIREFRVDASEIGNYAVGDKIDYASILAAGTALNVTGKSIGKGTLGNIRRWGHSRGPMSHGSKSHRLPGSIGAGTTPGRVFKGLPMAGRTGNKNTTILNLKVVRLISEKNIVLVKGSIPGCEGGLLVAKVR